MYELCVLIKGCIQVVYAKMVAPEGLGVNWHNGNDPPCHAPSLLLALCWMTSRGKSAARLKFMLAACLLYRLNLVSQARPFPFRSADRLCSVLKAIGAAERKDLACETRLNYCMSSQSTMHTVASRVE